jgi:ABC-type lipoprotein export system ATPase subunit
MSLRPLVVTRDLARTFGTGQTAVVAVHGVTCQIAAGQQVALQGPSGSGKSTLLHLLAGLDEPTTGFIEWPAIGTRPQLRPGPVAVVFQAPSLMAALNVLENVSLPQLLAGIEPDDARRSAIAALGTLDLTPLASKLPEELSGGQAQRVAVARALAGSARLILADEPTGQLDLASGTLIIDCLIEVARSTGAGLVINTHDEAVADRLPTRWTMSAGRLLQGADAQ